MKKAIILVSILAQSLSWGTVITSERILKDTTTKIAIRLDNDSVFCTARGYGLRAQLKVSVPDLEWLAHFDHRVEGEGIPCITAGFCSERLQPGKFIDPNDEFVVAPMRIVLSQILKIDDVKKSCTGSLKEEVFSQIRGHQFHHLKTGEEQSIEFKKCLLDSHP